MFTKVYYNNDFIFKINNRENFTESEYRSKSEPEIDIDSRCNISVSHHLK